ncbi:thiamine phosphate synthase, partial [Alistipes putredinis]
EIPAGFGGLISRSCHSFGEIASHPTEDYLFLSPIFDSISKTGYRAGYAPDELRKAFAQGIINPRVAALGGIRPEHLPALQEYGFGGAAFLGYIWQGATPEELVRRMREIRKFNR